MSSSSVAACIAAVAVTVIVVAAVGVGRSYRCSAGLNELSQVVDLSCYLFDSDVLILQLQGLLRDLGGLLLFDIHTG